MPTPALTPRQVNGRLHSTAPILASLNLAESIHFYTGMMGFVLMVQLDDYAILGRDGCEIHLHVCNNALIAQNTASSSGHPALMRYIRNLKHVVSGSGRLR